MSHNYLIIPYCYLIGWSELYKFYYGVKFGACEPANPATFWQTYFTSSELVKRYRQKYGDPDIMQIRKIFDPNIYGSIDNAQCAAVKHEQTVIKRARLVEKPYFLNCSSNVDNRTGEQITNHTKMRREKFSGEYFSKDGLESIKLHNSKFSTKNNPMKRDDVKKKHLDSIAIKIGYKNHDEYVNFVKETFEKHKTIKGTSNNTGHSHMVILTLLRKNFGQEYIDNIRKDGLKAAKEKSKTSNRKRIKADISAHKNPNAYVWEAISPTGEIHMIFGNRHDFCKKHGIGLDLDPMKPHKRNFWEFNKICRVKDYKPNNSL